MIRLNKDFPKLVKRQREGLGLTQQKAAARLRMPQQTLGGIEVGRQMNFTMKTLLRLLNGLDLELSDIFEAKKP